MKLYRKDITRPHEISNVICFGPEESYAVRRSIQISESQLLQYIHTTKLFKNGIEYYKNIGIELEHERVKHFHIHNNQFFFYNLEVSDELTGLELHYQEIGDDKYGSYGGYVTYSIDAKLDVIEIYEELYAWSKSIGADFYYDIFGSNTLITDEFLEQLRIRLGAKKISGERILEHTISAEGRFMAVENGDADTLLDFLKKKMSKSISRRLRIENIPWEEAFAARGEHEDELIVTPSIGGWVFVSGIWVDKILPVSNQEDDEAALIDSINLLSKKFKKVRWFDQSQKYNIKAYLKSDKGVLKYGVIDTEEGAKEFGMRPRELGKDKNPDINFIASKWCIDPDTFLYMPVLKGADVKVLRIE